MTWSRTLRTWLTLLPIALFLVLLIQYLAKSFSSRSPLRVECPSSNEASSSRICIQTAITKIDLEGEISDWNPLTEIKFAVISDTRLRRELLERLRRSFAPDLIVGQAEVFFRDTLKRNEAWTWYPPNSHGALIIDVPFGTYWICGYAYTKSIAILDEDRMKCILSDIRSNEKLPIFVTTKKEKPVLTIKSDEEQYPVADWSHYDRHTERLVKEDVVSNADRYGVLEVKTDLSAEIEVWPVGKEKIKVKIPASMKKLSLRPGNYVVKANNLLLTSIKTQNIRIEKRKITRVKFDLKQMMKR